MAASIPSLPSPPLPGRTILALGLAVALPGWTQGNWRSLSLPPSASVTVLHAAGDELLAGTSQGRIFASGDGGRSWIPRLLSGGAPASAIRTFGGDLYAAFGITGLDPYDCAPGYPCSYPSRQGGLFRSQDLGRTWTSVGDMGVSALAQRGSDLYIANGGGTPDRRVHRSPDAGLTWERLAAVDCRRMWASGSRLFVAVDGIGLRLSLDTGSTWQPWGVPPASDFAVQALVEKAGSILVGGSGKSPIRTLEEGAQAWQGTAEGLRDTPVSGILIRSGRVLAADGEGTYHLTPLASTRWQNPHAWSPSTVPGSLASAGDMVLAGGDALYHTRNLQDSGSWVRENVPHIKAMASGNQWAAVWTEALSESASENGLLVCGEGGLSGCREPARADLPQPQYLAITRMFRNSLHGMAIQGDTLAVALDSLHLSADRGESFQAFKPPSGWNFLGFHGGTLYAGSWDSLRVWRGGDWEPVPLAGVKAPATPQAMASRPGALYLATRSGIFRRADGGAAWEDLSQGLPHLAVRSLDVEGGLLVAGLEAGGVWARELDPVRTRPRARRKPPAPGYPGRYPAYRDASGAWVRIDGKPAAGR